MSRAARITVVTLSLIVFVYAGLGYLLGQTNDDNDKSYRPLTVYEEVLQHIQEDYVDQPNLNLVTAGALRGLLESLDPLSAYLSPREYADYRQREKAAQSGEVGLTLSKRFGYIIVVSVVPGGPGDQAGIRTGQILESIGGFGTRNMSVAQANMLLQGTPGATVKVEVVHRGTTAPKQVTLTRAVVGPQKIVASHVGNDTGYIRMPTMESGDVAQLHDKLAEFNKSGVHKLVLDLRNCSRGPIAKGIEAARFFLSSGVIATLQGQTVPRRQFTAERGKVVWTGPVAVLAGPSTSGAAEILAGAIEGNKRGDVVGTDRTFGMASEQKLIPLNDGGALLLTVAYYSTPDGKSIVEDGVVPTVEVQPPSSGDVMLNDAEPPSPLGPGQLPKADDPVYNKALELLQGNAARKAA